MSSEHPGRPAVMFVCTGNTCRSPFAERLAAHLDPSTRFTSTGTHLLGDLGMDPAMADCLRRLGVDGTGFRSRRLDGSLLAEADLVVCMTRSHRAWVVEAFPEAAPRTVVLKPYAQLVESGAAEPWQPPVTMSEPASSPGWLDDVADPYRLGWNEAQRAADEIEAALRLILGAERAGGLARIPGEQ